MSALSRLALVQGLVSNGHCVSIRWDYCLTIFTLGYHNMMLVRHRLGNISSILEKAFTWKFLRCFGLFLFSFNLDHIFNISVHPPKALFSWIISLRRSCLRRDDPWPVCIFVFEQDMVIASLLKLNWVALSHIRLLKVGARAAWSHWEWLPHACERSHNVLQPRHMLSRTRSRDRSWSPDSSVLGWPCYVLILLCDPIDARFPYLGVMLSENVLQRSNRIHGFLGIPSCHVYWVTLSFYLVVLIFNLTGCIVSFLPRID